MADLKPCTATHHNAYQTEKDGECRPAFAICRKAQSRRASSVPCSPKSLLAKAIGPPARARPTLMASIAACGACGIPYQRTPHDNQQAESWLRRSIELDPTLARAHTILARVLAARCWLGSSDDIDRDLTCCRGARRSDAAAHYAVSIIDLMLHKHEWALRAARRAIDLNPTLRMGILRSAKPAFSWVNSPRPSIH
jgi:hypothetical protein